MTQEEAISLLNNITSYCDFEDEYGDMIDSEPYYEAVDLAIKALSSWDKYSDELWKKAYARGYNDAKTLEQQPCEDCTSEEEVTDIILSIARNLEHICEVIRK